MISRLRRNLRVLGATFAFGLTSYYVQPFSPPDWYGELWTEIKDCVGIEEDISQPKYFSIVGHGFLCYDLISISLCAGASSMIGRYVFISEEHANDTSTVAHEQLHQLGLNHGEEKTKACLENISKDSSKGHSHKIN